MKPPIQPYKRSIWTHDARYDLPSAGFAPQESIVIARLMSVDSAKKQVPPIPPMQLLQISALAKKLPPAQSATKRDVEDYLSARHQLFGAGIAVMICMLSVESNGDYPPMDRKFAAGMRARGKIDQTQESSLTSPSDTDFAAVYVEKIIPAWHESRLTRTPKEADDYWGSSE